MKMVFQVEHVMSGDSDTIGLEGRDAAGRRLRLDVPASEAVRSGSVLVIEWWAAELPERAVTTVAEHVQEPPEATDAEADAESVELEFRRLIGLK